MTLKTSATANSNGKLLGDPLDYRFEYEYAEGYAHRAKQIGERYYQYDRNGNVTVEQDGPFEVTARTGNAGVKRIGDVNYVEEAWGLNEGSGGGSGGQSKYRREYIWDERNRLAVSADGRYNVQYTYDHGGERTGKYAAGASGSRTETLYFSKLWTWTHSGLWTDSQGRYSKHIFLGESRIATKIVAGDGHHVPRAEELRQYYYHSDHLGSAQLITNYEGAEYERLEYTPYGELWIEKAAEASVLDIAYRFTGKERDEETGNYYYGARYLDPRTSRWLSTDPAVGEYIPRAPVNDEARKRNGNLPGQGGVFNYVNLHVYHYAGNNPVKYVDPDGNDYFLATYSKSTGTITASYLYADSSGNITRGSGYKFSVSNNVVSGMRKTMPASGESSWYFPKGFPKGLWGIYKSKQKEGQPAFGNVFIPTTATQTVDTYGPANLPQPQPDEDGNYTVTGTQVDTGYGGHYSEFNTTLGCFKFDNQADADKFAELSDRALDSQGGKSTIYVTD
jgi:RHS repeat-associated protein